MHFFARRAVACLPALFRPLYLSGYWLPATGYCRPAQLRSENDSINPCSDKGRGMSLDERRPILPEREVETGRILA